MKHILTTLFILVAFAATSCFADLPLPPPGFDDDEFSIPSCCDGILNGIDGGSSGGACWFHQGIYETNEFEEMFCMCDAGPLVPTSECLDCCQDVYHESYDCFGTFNQFMSCEEGCFQSCRDTCAQAHSRCFDVCFGNGDRGCFDGCFDDFFACSDECNQDRTESILGGLGK